MSLVEETFGKAENYRAQGDRIKFLERQVERTRIRADILQNQVHELIIYTDIVHIIMIRDWIVELNMITQLDEMHRARIFKVQQSTSIHLKNFNNCIQSKLVT